MRFSILVFLLFKKPPLIEASAYVQAVQVLKIILP